MIFKWWAPRRAVQVGMLMLIMSPLLGMDVFSGNLASAEFLGFEFTDPVAFLQATLASRTFLPSFLGGAAIVAFFYFLAGGRTFCGWICPVYFLTEMGDKLASRTGSGKRHFSLSGTRWSLVLVAIVSLLAGIPLFEVLSPIGIATRAVMFQSLLPLLLIAAILVIEVFIANRLWCRSLCPIGGFYALLGRFSPLRIGFHKRLCNNCGECRPVCPVKEVLEPALADGAPQIVSGDCTRCGACMDACQTKALEFNFGYKKI